ncbi:MAG: CarD family transcriptional regulator [Acidiphilium sp. 37-67-22]|nr:MAG: CarD family transcriptional regulator [Acidiphilium sp. 37-67-22]HQT72683.1 CarD family transcriptional regulator [Acidiphilium sp.]
MKRPASTDPASAGADVSSSVKAVRVKAASKPAAAPPELRPEKAPPRRAARTAVDAPMAKTEKDSQPDMPSPNAAQTEPEATEAERDALPPPGPRPVLPQRAIAKAETFKPGDHVVYPTHGVGKVERIAAEEIAGQKLELIHITFDENRMTLRVPVNKARTAGLRKLSSRKQFDEVLAALKGRARVKRTMWSRRAQEYEAKINSGDPMAIAEVVRDLHRNAGQPDQSFSERQIFEQALDRLAAEYGALEGLGKQEAIDKLLDFLKTE